MFSSVKNFLITFFVSIIIFGIIAYFVVNFAMEAMIPTEDIPVNGTTDDPNDSSNPDSPQTDDMSEDTSSTQNPEIPPVDLSAVKGKSFNALLIGTDYLPSYFMDYDLTEVNKNSSGFPQKERIVSADAILIFSVDKEKGRVMFSSVPSNMKVMADGVYTALGSLYNTKGAEYIKNKVTALTGISIDYYAVTHVQDFSKLIDNINGINFDVPVDMNYEDTTEGLVINVKKGSQLLSGDTAENMLRYCSYADGNISRMNLTVNFAKAVLKQLTSAEYMSNAVSLYQSFSKYVHTNFTEADLTENLELIYAYSSMASDEITYPGTVKISDGIEYFEPSINSAISLYEQYR